MANKKVIIVATGTAEEPTIEAAAFRVESPDGTAREHTLGIGTYGVGSSSCELQLRGDDAVAAQHARLRVSPGGVTITSTDPRLPLYDAAGQSVRTVHHMRIDEPVRVGNHILILRRPIPARSGSMPAPAATLPALHRPSLSPTSVASPVVSSRTAATSPELPALRRTRASGPAPSSSSPSSSSRSAEHEKDPGRSK